VTKRYIKPARVGLVVRQPSNGKPIPAEGIWVDWSGHWVRRKIEGSIVEAKPPVNAKKASKPKAQDKADTANQKEAD
jgi:hypothetical protein